MASAEAGAAAALASGSRLQRSILAAAPRAAAPGQVKRDCVSRWRSVSSCPSRPKAACSSSRAAGLSQTGTKSVLTRYLSSSPSRSLPSAPQPSRFEVRWRCPQGHPNAPHYGTVVNSQVPALLTRQCSLFPAWPWKGGRVEGGGGEGPAEGGMQRSV